MIDDIPMYLYPSTHILVSFTLDCLVSGPFSPSDKGFIVREEKRPENAYFSVNLREPADVSM